MPVEALIWSLLLVLGPAFAERLWPMLRQRIPPLPINVELWAPWIHGLMLPYLAIIVGSVSGRQVGLYGGQPGVWIAGVIACGIGLILASTLVRRLANLPEPEGELYAVLLDETRWAFYRAAAALWIAGLLSALLGFGMAFIELGLTHALVSGRSAPSQAQWKRLMRAALSTLLFIATGNFWLTAMTQLLLQLVVRREVQRNPTI